MRLPEKDMATDSALASALWQKAKGMQATALLLQVRQRGLCQPQQGARS